jgi:uncharacterized damage-inducible protein DinB
MKSLAIAALLFIATAPIIAQQGKDAPTGNPLLTAARGMEERFAKNVTSALEAMPADKYNFKPTPDQMSFGHLAMHIAEANNNFCASVAGQSIPELKVSESDPKDKLVSAAKDSFAFCQQALAKTDDSTLGQNATLFGQSVTRGAALLRLTASWGDHYGAASMYLRLNNLLPPTAGKH